MSIKKFVVIGLLFLTPLFMISIISCSTSNWKAKLVSFIQDGDTFTTSDNQIYRLIGVDTPESYRGSASTVGIEAFYAKKAKEFTSKFLLNKTAMFLEHTLDKYNRRVSRVSVNDEDLSLFIAKAGLARVGYISCDSKNLFYYSDVKYIKNLLINQQYAKNNMIGIWKEKDHIKQIFPKSNITIPDSC